MSPEQPASPPPPLMPAMAEIERRVVMKIGTLFDIERACRVARDEGATDESVAGFNGHGDLVIYVGRRWS